MDNAHTPRLESIDHSSIDPCLVRHSQPVDVTMSRHEKHAVEFMEAYGTREEFSVGTFKTSIMTGLVANNCCYARIRDLASVFDTQTPVLPADYTIPTLLAENAQSTMTVLLETRFSGTKHMLLPGIIVEDLEPLAPLCYRDYGQTNEMFVAMRNGSAHLWSRWAPAGGRVVSIEEGDSGAFALIRNSAEKQSEDDEDHDFADSIYDDTSFQDSDTDSDSDYGTDSGQEHDSEDGSDSDEWEESDDGDGVCVVFG
jgi:hypothetical protein